MGDGRGDKLQPPSRPMITATTRVEWLMIDTPTRRAVLGAGALAAGSLFGIDRGVAQTPLSPTPACHDGDEATLPQIEGPYFKPSSPAPVNRSREPCWISGRPTIRAGMTIPVSACAVISSPTRKAAIDCVASCPASMLAARAISM